MRKINEKIATRSEEDTDRVDSPPYPDFNSDTHVKPDRGSTTSTPRWVKVFGIIALILVLLFVVLHLTGNSLGGHGGHMSDGPDDHTPPIEYGVQ